MAKQATTKKAAPKKAVGKSKSVKEAKRKPITISQMAYSRGYEIGKKIGASFEKMDNLMNQLVPKVTARVSFELDEANNCKINVSGDFNVILKKVNEIKNSPIQSATDDFFGGVSQLMKKEQK